jgi:hypothetical protein
MSEPIYPYIPFAGALVWNRLNEDENLDVKIHVSFSPDWFARRMDFDYGRQWHEDPIYRRDSFVAMAKTLNGEFPILKLGGEPNSISGGISQIYSCALIAALFGQEIKFSSKNWPENTGKPIDDHAADAIEVPDFYNDPVFIKIMEQMDFIGKEWGEVDGELNYQGVLNTAYRIRGEKIFTDMLLFPERAHRVLSVVCETMIQVADAVYAQQKMTGVYKDYFVTSNCVVNMISGESYREYILPYDRKISEHFQNFGVHNCGWNVDAYAQSYTEIGSLGYLDFGIDSDLARIKDLFPETILTVILNPDDIIGKDNNELRELLIRLYETLGKCRILAGSLDNSTPSSVVTSLFDITADVWGLPINALVPHPHCG